MNCSVTPSSYGGREGDGNTELSYTESPSAASEAVGAAKSVITSARREATNDDLAQLANSATICFLADLAEEFLGPLSVKNVKMLANF